MSTPSPEAIEAGAKALYELAPTYTYGTSTGFHSEPVPWERVSPDNQGHIRSMATAALTAAAPYMEAHAKVEALREAADDIQGDAPVSGAYSSYLRTRADQIEGKSE